MTSRAHYVLDDLKYRADQKILFTGLPSLRITNFAWAVEFKEASQDPGRGVMLLPFEILLPRHSIAPFWDDQLFSGWSATTRMCPPSTIPHGPDRGFLCLAEARHFYPADANTNIDINQRDVEPWFPLILLPPGACEVCSRQRRVVARDICKQIRITLDFVLANAKPIISVLFFGCKRPNQSSHRRDDY
jgi:hypothetical protein